MVLKFFFFVKDWEKGLEDPHGGIVLWKSRKNFVIWKPSFCVLTFKYFSLYRIGLNKVFTI